MSNVSLINGHIEEEHGLYILCDVDGQGIYGVFSTLEKAEAAKEVLIKRFVNKYIAEPVENINPTQTFVRWLIEDTQRSYMIKYINVNLDELEGSCA